VATVLPENASNKNVAWSSSAPGVATVNNSGLVTAVANGSTTITVATQDGNKTATCAVTVAPVAATGVTLNRRNMSLALGESEPIVATVLPENAANKNVTWTTSNAGIATVSAAGVVTATGRGTATITATTADGGHKATCDVSLVNVYVAGQDEMWRAAVWKNGALYPLTQLTDTVAEGTGCSVYVTDAGDVYVLDREWEYEELDYSPWYRYAVTTKVWKNGLPHLSMPIEGHYYSGTNIVERAYHQPHSIFVSGSDVYVCGILIKTPAYSSTTEYHPRLWKNGVLQPLEYDAETKYAWPQSVFAANGNVYVAGSGRVGTPVRQFAALWVNGSVTYLHSAEAVSGMAQSVFVSGGDVYVGGVETIDGHPRATVWKNGAAQHYAIPNESSLGEYVSSIFVSGNDVYAADYCFYMNSPQRTGAFLWKNGVVQQLSPQDGHAGAYSVNVFGDDVYILGSEAVDGEEIVTIWKNGVARRLPNSVRLWSYGELAAARVTQGVTSVSLDKTSMEVYAGFKGWLTAAVQPYNAANAVSWSSSNNSIATVAADGTVTGVALGSATITATTVDGNRAATCQVTVLAPVRVTGVTVNQTEYQVAVRTSFDLWSIVQPNNATNQNVTWTSSNPSVAAITDVYSDGYFYEGYACAVSAVAPGTAAITARTEDGGFAATCVVTVFAVPVTGVSLSQSAMSLVVGDPVRQLSASFQPSTATNRNIAWTISNPAVVEIAANYGYYIYVRGASAGTATITAVTEDGSFTATCEVTVTESGIAHPPVDAESFGPAPFGIDPAETQDALGVRRRGRIARRVEPVQLPAPVINGPAGAAFAVN
jgi:uncharacterized protein YjdB